MIVILWVLCGVPGGTPIEFNRDIRPILSENCFKCHGHDEKNRQGGLRLDEEEHAFGEGESGKTAIVRGKREESELMARILSNDEGTRMPPDDSGRSLTAAQIELLGRWIDDGARYERHWSFMPIRRPEPPAVDRQGFRKNEIDAFVLAGLESAKIEPSPFADSATLIRRLHLDLTGLPPEPADVRAFERDPSDQAYEQLVDRLLASPSFGERQAMTWLDLVRYADSVGYHGDQSVNVSPYRDYVIDSFNTNKPFDVFTVEQIAGDYLPESTRQHQIASGYNRLGMMSAEGGIQDKEYRAKYAAERVRNLGGTWLGLTLGCCECHDHKYDPISTKEFYQIEAFFADIDEKGFYNQGFARNDWGPSIPVPTESQSLGLAEFDRKIADVKARLDEQSPEVESEQEAWEKALLDRPTWTPVDVLTATAKSGSPLRVLEDQSILAEGKASDTDSYSITCRFPVVGVTAIRLEAIPDDSLPQHGPGRADNGNFVVSQVSVSYQREPQGTLQPIVLDRASASFEQEDAGKPNLGPAGSIDRDVRTLGWAIMPRAGQSHEAVFETILDLTAEKDAIVTITLDQHLNNPRHLLGRFRLSVTNHARPVKAFGAGLPREIRDILARDISTRTSEESRSLSAYYRSIAPSLAPVRDRLALLEKKKAEVSKTVRTTLVTKHVEPRSIRVLARGNWMDDSGEIVEPGYPRALTQASSSSTRLNRLDLAKWLVSADNPLTARVFVNRLWKLHFGAGLARKLDDFGSQGEAPSHPELLDYLAGRFIDSGWDVKSLVKSIVMSGAYRMSSNSTPTLLERDPANRLLARQGRFRLDAELIRDNALFVSGLLNNEVGGASVFPAQPAGYFAFLNFPVREWQKSEGSSLYRRGLYTHWQRQYLHPALLAFDAPSREECTADRVRSNTPLQSLVLLNDPCFVEAARVFAERALAEGGDNDEARLSWLIENALSRSPREDELRILGDLLAKERESFSRDVASAGELIKVGDWPSREQGSPEERASWTCVARAILNTHSFVTRN